MSLADRVSNQLSMVEQSLEKINVVQEQESSSTTVSVSTSSLASLREEILYLQTLCGILNQFSSTSPSMQEGANNIISAIQQISSVNFSAVILREGEEEEGPYYYFGLNGIPNAQAFAQKPCTFSYSGVLARVMYQRLNPEDPDYVYLHDLSNCALAVREEFSWLPKHGSMLAIPLRTSQSTEGVLFLGKCDPAGFDDMTLRENLYDIAISGSTLIYNARMTVEISKHEEQLVNAQLLTKAISNAQFFPEVIDVLLEKVPEITANSNIQIVLQNSLFDYSTNLGKHLQLDILDQPFRIFSDSSIDASFPFTPNTFDQPTTASIVQWTIRSGQPVFFTPELLEDNPEHPFYSSSGRSIVVPIQGKDISYGVILITAVEQQFDESDMVVLRTIANSVAITLRSIYMYEKYQQASQDTSAVAEENMLLGLKKLHSSIYSPSVYTGDSDSVVPWLMAIE